MTRCFSMITIATAPPSPGIGRLAQPRRLAAVVAALLTLSAGAVSAEIGGSASLSRSTAQVGDPVSLRVTIEGTTKVEPPPPPSVDGLSIQLTGRQLRQSIVNLQARVEVIVTYTIVGEKPGRYTIPSIVITAEDRPFQTPKLELEIVSAPPTAAPQNQKSLFFAEISVPKSRAYVGELIPVDIRFYYNRQINFQPEQPPIISGEGYTAQKLAEPDITQEIVEGELYNVITYRTAIAGVRPGPIELGPITQQVVIQTPSRQPRFRSPLDDFFGDDSPFGGMPFGGMMMDTRRETVSTDSRKLEILALPEENRPPEFAGAVGDFTLASSVQPREGEAGEPISVTHQIRGRGNFDRVSAPVIEASPIWRAYPPSESFQAADPIGMNGVKSFETVMVPSEPTTSLPPAKFVYFDPDKAEYITRETPPFPVEIIGRRDGAPASLTRATPSPEPTPEEELEVPPDDIPPLATTLGSLARQSISTLETPLYLSANAAPALLLLGLLTWGGVRSFRTRNAEAIAYRRALRHGMHQLRTAKDEQRGTEAFEGLLQLLLAPGAFDSLRDLLASRPELSAESIQQAQALLDTHERLRYTPGETGGSWSAATRDFALGVIRQLEQATRKTEGQS